MNSELKVISLLSRDIEELVELSKPFHKQGWDFERWEHGCLTHLNIPESFHIKDLLRNLPLQLQQDGYIILDLKELLDNYNEGHAATIATLLLSFIGEPIKIFDKLNSHWRKVSVDLTKHPNKSEGVGKSPLHMDFVNAEFPPDYVCLFAIRHDANEGGQTILANFKDIEREIDQSSYDELQESQFSDGQVINLSNVGTDVNPFAIINPQHKWKYRITGNLLTTEVETNASVAVKSLFERLEDRKIAFLLKKGYFLVINQHMMLHGKESLGDLQEFIPDDKRRLLMHAFIRDKKI